MIDKISVSSGPWVCVPSTGDVLGCVEIATEAGQIIGMAHELHDAVLMACSKEMFDALIDVHRILENVEDSPIKDVIEERLSIAFEKIVAEADV